MTLKQATALITSIQQNLDGRMKYNYQATPLNTFKLTMLDTVSGLVRFLNFKLKEAENKEVEVEFNCEEFRFNFPLKKNVSAFTFNLNDFSLLLEYGIKVNENNLHPEMDLDVEF